MFLAERLADFVIRTRGQAPPPAALAAARLRLLDGLAVALAALPAPSVVEPRSVLAIFGRDGLASAVGRRAPLPAAAAVLHNGLLMHGLEFDDTHIGAVVHGAPVVLPAVLAYAEQYGHPGDAVLAAICVGWEVHARIGAALRGELQRYGFQATSVAGPLAAAGGVAFLSGLDSRRTADALGIAGSQSCGVFEFLGSGATSKSLHGGWAALAGLVSATLAADGMTGPASILEGRNGLFSAFARAPELAARMAAQLEDLGSTWAVAQTRPKVSPCCHYIQAFIEALDAVLGRGIAAESIRSIRCTVDPRQAQLICEPWQEKLAPPSGYAAKWSLPYCLAARALRGPLSVELFERPLDPELLAFARRIDWCAEEDGFPERYPGRVRVTLDDGRSIDSRVPDVMGSPERPFPDQLLIEKYRCASASVLPAAAASELLREVLALERSPSLGVLGGHLRNAQAGLHQSSAQRESA